MAIEYIEVVAEPGSESTICAIAEQCEAIDIRLGAIGEDGLQWSRLLVSNKQLQPTLDQLQRALGAQARARIVVLPVEMSLPSDANSANADDKPDTFDTTREELQQSVGKNAQLNANYIVLVVLSTIVAAIGMIKNNIAVIIGAMVIAPLLGPSLALSLGVALDDKNMVRNAARTLASGIAIAVVLSALLGLAWNNGNISTELSSRTEVGLDSIALALASGSAAALSLTTGLSSVLVGVMVAVALLPPAAAVGLMLGYGYFALAGKAALLLLINILCVNLASNLVFITKKIWPRTTAAQKLAKRNTAFYMLAVCLILALTFPYI